MVLVNSHLMREKALWLGTAAVIISFAAGFLVANSLNKKEIDALKSENSKIKAAPQPTPEDGLSNDEIRAKIEQADNNAGDIAFQKSLGTALYRFSALKRDYTFLPDIERLLERARQADPQNRELTVTLADVYFDSSQSSNKNEDLLKARTLYEKALQQKAADADARTDFGLTFLLAQSPNASAAEAEFQRALQIDPRHEKALQSEAQALIGQNKFAEASSYIVKLRAVNPKNELLPELDSAVQRGTK
jgi:TPR repeat protein